MPKEPKTPKVSYQYVADESAVNAVFDMLFEKLLEQKSEQKQATKATKNGKNEA
ncbi:MAG: hypothetical protein V4702_03690 [Patescibacteria group bacterium]